MDEEHDCPDKLNHRAKEAKDSQHLHHNDVSNIPLDLILFYVIIIQQECKFDYSVEKGQFFTAAHMQPHWQYQLYDCVRAPNKMLIMLSKSNLTVWLSSWIFIFFCPFYLPDKYTDIILRISVGRNRRYACSHCYVTVDLNKA